MSEQRPSADISSYLDALYDRYDGFDVHQTTVSVSPEEFDEVDSRDGVAEVRVRVEGTQGLLAIPGDDGWVTPGGVVEDEPLPEAAGRLVEKQTGIECRIDELLRVSLVCLQCDGTDDEVWELSATFSGTAESETATEEAAWREQLSEPSVAF